VKPDRPDLPAGAAETLSTSREDTMDQKQIAKQMIQFNKTTFDNSFKAMTMVYEQNEKMLNTFLDQAAWMPPDGKKAVTDWMGSYKKGCDDFKKMVDDNYKKVESFFSGSGK
jgi:hypothetical protein